ncbi:DUF2304 domain-containing protein [Candidatus Woesearchaeota archaeon]|nr:DUF2304 domain-containing protein [Candidatus Woesearchaeota archaeon]
MIYGLQLIGILFGLVMVYITFLFYKRRDYELRGFVAWLGIWLVFLALVLFPSTIYGVMETLRIERTVDFFVIAGFMFFAVLIFKVYDTTKRTQKKVESLVRGFAMRSPRYDPERLRKGVRKRTGR